jgi:hypothetical protein
VKRFAVSIAWAVLVCGCAMGRAERIAKLSPDSSQQFAKYKQFMTEGQQQRYLEAPTDLERTQMVEGLKIDDMLSQFPKPVQDMIWAQQVSLGMNKAAVLLSWGGPYQREFDEDALSRGNEIERWTYKRNDRTAYVTFTNGIVSDYDDGSR